MAITNLGSAANGATSTLTQITLTGNATVGGLVLIAIMENATDDISSVIDSRSNTYTRVKSDVAAFPNTFVYQTTQTGGHLITGDTINVNTSSTHSAGVVLAVAMDCPGYVSTVDQTASQVTTASTARNAGTTATTTSVNELVVGVFGAHVIETSFTPAAGYTSLFSAPAYFTNSGASNTLEVVYQEVTATGAYAPSGTGGASGNSTGVAVTYASTTQPSGGGSNLALFSHPGRFLHQKGIR